MDSWNDFRYLLAVAREGTLVGAAEQLEVNQTTVGRRLTSLEAALGTSLFNRVEQRLVPTDAGRIALAHAEQIERQVLDCAIEITGRDQYVTGHIKVTALSLVTNTILAPQLGKLHETYPNLSIELIDSPKNLDLAKLEADVALRLARPRLPSVVTRRLGWIDCHVYAQAQYQDQADQLPWACYLESMDELPECVWINGQLHGEQPLLRVADDAAMVSVLSKVRCRSVVPAIRVSEASGLVRIGGPEPVVRRELWLVYLKSMRHNARIRAFADWVVSTCEQALTQ